MKRPWLFVVSILVTLTLLLLSPIVPTPLAYGAIRKLTSGPGGVSKFEISADGQWIVFLKSEGSTMSLYSVPTMGGTVTKLAESLPWGDAQTSSWRRVFAISPDSQSVLYFGRPDPTPTPTPVPGQPYVRYPGMGLYHVPIDGSSGSTVVADDPRVHTFGFSADSLYAVYVTGTGTDNDTYRFELYSRSFTGAPAQRLNIDLPTGKSVVFDRWVVLASGYVLYAVGAPSFSPPYGPSYGSVDLYTVSVNGPASNSVQLTTCSQVALPSWPYAVTSDGQHIVFPQTDCDGNGVLRSVGPTGTTPIRLSPPATSQIPGDIVISADGRFVTYSLTDMSQQPSPRDLYFAPVAGPSSDIHLVQSASALGVNPVPVGLTPNGDWLAFMAPTSDTFEAPTPLYVASRTGATNSARLVTGSFPNGPYPRFSIDSRYLIYQEVGGTFMSLELVNGSLPISLGIAAASYTAVYTPSNPNRLVIRHVGDGFLYSVLAAGPAASFVRISHDLVDNYSPVRFTPNGQHVIFIGFSDGQLYLSDIDVAYNEATPICADPPGCGTPSASPSTTAPASATPTPTPTAPPPAQYPVFLPDLRRSS